MQSFLTCEVCVRNTLNQTTIDVLMFGKNFLCAILVTSIGRKILTNELSEIMIIAL